MNTQCPFCHEAYEIGDQYQGVEVACPVCGQTFVPQPDGSFMAYAKSDGAAVPCYPEASGNDVGIAAPSSADMGPQGGAKPYGMGRHREIRLKKIIGILIPVCVLLLLGCYYFLVPNVWRARRNCTGFLVECIESASDVVDSSALTKLCRIEADLGYAKAKRAHEEDLWIAYWCDGGVRDAYNWICKGQRLTAEWQLKKITKDYGKHDGYGDAKEAYEKEVEECAPKAGYITRRLQVFSRWAKSESCSPSSGDLSALKKIALENYYCRSLLLDYLEDKCKLSGEELRDKGHDALSEILLTAYSRKVRIVNSSALKSLCDSTAEDMLKKLEDRWGEDVMFDFVRLICSDVLQETLDEDAATMSPLRDAVSEYMPNLSHWLSHSAGRYSDFHKAYENFVR